MNVPFGRLDSMLYRKASFYTGTGQVGSMEVLRVNYITPHDEVDYQDLSNPMNWVLDNQALQFMAKWGYRPSDFDGTYLDCYDDQVLVPLAPMDADQPLGEPGFGLHESALENGREALQEAEWFDEGDGQGDDGNGPDEPPGGGDPDPGTGNRAGVDHDEEADVVMEVADEDSDSGVEVTVS